MVSRAKRHHLIVVHGFHILSRNTFVFCEMVARPMFEQCKLFLRPTLYSTSPMATAEVARVQCCNEPSPGRIQGFHHQSFQGWSHSQGCQRARDARSLYWGWQAHSHSIHHQRTSSATLPTPLETLALIPSRTASAWPVCEHVLAFCTPTTAVLVFIDLRRGRRCQYPLIRPLACQNKTHPSTSFRCLLADATTTAHSADSGCGAHLRWDYR